MSPQIHNKEEAIEYLAKTANGVALRNLNMTYRRDYDVVSYAINLNALSLDYASPRLKNNKQLAIQAVTANPMAVRYIGRKLMGDVDVARAYCGFLKGNNFVPNRLLLSVVDKLFSEKVVLKIAPEIFDRIWENGVKERNNLLAGERWELKWHDAEIEFFYRLNNVIQDKAKLAKASVKIAKSHPEFAVSFLSSFLPDFNYHKMHSNVLTINQKLQQLLYEALAKDKDIMIMYFKHQMLNG